MTDLIERLRQQIPHYECEDCWYSCATITCDDERREGDCDCGADYHNAIRAEAANALASAAQRGSPEEVELSHLAQELERARCVAIVDAVREHQKAFEADGMPTSFSSGFDLACEEIKHRVLFEPWTLQVDRGDAKDGSPK